MSRCTNGDEGKPAEKRRVTERKMDRGRRSRVGGGGMRGAQRELFENRIFFEIGDIMKMTGLRVFTSRRWRVLSVKEFQRYNQPFS